MRLALSKRPWQCALGEPVIVYISGCDYCLCCQRALASPLFFFCCSTQLALQLRQKRSQLVCSNRGAPGPRALPQWTLNLKAYAHSCRQTSKKQNKTHMRKHATCMNNRVPKQQFYISSYLFNFFLTFHDLVLMRWILIVSKNY